MATSCKRMAPCFAGVDLWIFDSDASMQGDDQTGLENIEVISTHGWHPLGWGRELMRHDVGLLLCSGIDQSTWGSIRGHGIQVIPDALGDAGSVLAAWRKGQLAPPRQWPAYPKGFDIARYPGLGKGWGRKRCRFRGGKR
ncbi:MAG: hypothetical protein JW808_03490 [Victivallales bacterium]|nr:hypothetical protein [Victivallales bacterium]